MLNLACTNVLFSFNNKAYVQIDGMAMGSNLGPTMASFAMNMVESRFTSKPLFYKRYVDDIFCIFNNKQEAINFLAHINTINDNINFTVEHEVNKKLTY